MPIPLRSDPVWQNLLNGTTTITFGYMGLNLMVFNLKTRVKRDPSQMDSAIDELIQFFQDHQSSPKIQEDITKLK